MTPLPAQQAFTDKCLINTAHRGKLSDASKTLLRLMQALTCIILIASVKSASAVTITSLSKKSGSTYGGYDIIVTGTGLDTWGTGTTQILFGTIPATNVEVFNFYGYIGARCKVPAAPLGTVDVTIINPDNSSDTLAHAFTYAAPVIFDVRKREGSIAGGNRISLIGGNFSPRGDPQVYFDGIPATDELVTLQDSTLNLFTPPHAAGASIVTLTHSNGETATAPVAFTFVPMSLEQVSPSSGSTLGSPRGYSVAVMGKGMSNKGVTVLFGGIPASLYGWGDEHYEIRAITPPHSAGKVDVTVINPDGEAVTLRNAYTYRSTLDLSQCAADLTSDDDAPQVALKFERKLSRPKVITKLFPTNYPYRVNQVCVVLKAVNLWSSRIDLTFLLYLSNDDGTPGPLVAVSEGRSVRMGSEPGVYVFDVSNEHFVAPRGPIWLGVSWDMIPDQRLGAEVIQASQVEEPLSYFRTGIEPWAPLERVAMIRAAGDVVAGEGEGEIEDIRGHSGDLNQDGFLDLSELLRVVQLFNSSEYHCDPLGEDGYASGPGSRDCVAHSSDYNAQDWRISISELIRAIQFRNLGYHFCYNPSSEDGFCPGSW